MGKKPKYPRNYARPNRVESNTIAAIDRLAELEKFESSILPVIKKDLDSGLSSTAIAKKYAALAAARVATIVARELDSGKALAAAKDLLDRADGKATEKKEVTHRLANLPDEELKAYVLTKLKDRAQLTEGTEDDDTESEDTDEA